MTVLTQEQKVHFINNGFIKIEGGIPPENVADFTSEIWTRLGWDPKDRSTWDAEAVHMPRHREVETKDFMPKVYEAMCE